MSVFHLLGSTGFLTWHHFFFFGEPVLVDNESPAISFIPYTREHPFRRAKRLRENGDK